MRCGRLLAASNSEWYAALQRTRHDAYHLPGYVTTDADRCIATPVTFYWANGQGRELLLPLLVRTIPGSHLVDATSPYGYPAPVVSKDGFRQEDWSDACRALVDALKEYGLISCFVRLHPLLDADLDSLSAAGCVKYHGDTVNVDLRLTPEQLHGQVRANHRRDIRRAKSNGLRVIVDSKREHLEEFVSLYHETMHRVGATEDYFFSRDYFLNLFEALSDHCHLVVALTDGDVAAGGVFFEEDGIVQYHLGGTRTVYLRFQPTKLIFDFVTKWSRDRGNTDFHLGGGVGGPSNPLLHFKIGFSPDRRPFRTWRIVVDEYQYGSLCASADADADDRGGFFPAYRDPTRRPVG